MIKLKKTASLPFLILIIALSAIIYECAPVKMVTRRGVLMREDQAASLDFPACERLSQEKKFKDSLTCFDIFIKTYPQNKLVPDALYRNAFTYKKLGDMAKAQANLEQIVLRYPLSHIINDARYGLGKIYMYKKMYREARDALSAINLTLYESIKQTEILEALREALKILELWKELVDCDIKLYDISTEFNFVTEIKRELIETIDGRLSEKELIAIKEQRNGFPGDTALFKLTKLRYHDRDFDPAKDLAMEFLKRFPVSEHYNDALELYRRIAERKSPDPKTIGLLLPLSGPNSAIGELALKGIWLASGFYNNANQRDDFKIVIRDTEGSPDATEKAFDELVYEEGAIGIMGPMLAKTSEVGALKAQELGVPVILLNQNEKVTEIGDFVFRNFISKGPQAKILAKFAVENLGIRRFAFLYPNHGYGMEFFNAFWDELTNYPDVEIRGAEKYEPSINDFSEPIKKLTGLYDLSARASEICEKKALPKLPPESEEKTCYEPAALPPIIDFEALVMPDSFEKIAQIAPALLYHNLKGVQLVGCNLWDSDDIFKENSGKYIQGAIITDVFFLNSKKPGARSFIDAYRRAFDSDPDIIAAHAYETTLIFLKAVTEANPKSHDQLREVLKNKTNFDTVSGRKSFFNKGDFEHDYSVLLVDGNEFKEIF